MAFTAMLSCKEEAQQREAQIPSLPVTKVETMDMEGYDDFPGNIEGKINNAVRPKISGYITQVLVDEGQHVNRGQLLFKLETDVQSQDANAAKAAINAAQANVEAAQAAVNAAQLQVNSLRPLAEKNIIGSVQLETAEADLMRAKGQLEQSRAAKGQAEAQYRAISANIGYSDVRSPITGIVGSINFREGSLVGPNDPTPITTVSETGEVYAYFSMNEKQYFDFLEHAPGKTIKEKLNSISEVELILPNGKTYPEKGKIGTVTGQINPATGSIQFRATFKNKDGLLSNGNSGTIRVPREYPDAVTIPSSATFEQQGMTYVYTVKQDTAFTTVITVEDQVGNLSIIGSGLEKGEEIVLDGMHQLRNKSALQPQPVPYKDAIKAIQPVM